MTRTVELSHFEIGKSEKGAGGWRLVRLAIVGFYTDTCEELTMTEYFHIRNDKDLERHKRKLRDHYLKTAKNCELEVRFANSKKAA